jgi:hypothetical protein
LLNLVVIADQAYRELVGRILEELDLPRVVVVTWRDAIAITNDSPSFIVADLDDVGPAARGLDAMRRATLVLTWRARGLNPFTEFQNLLLSPQV